jgi:hypothetical protein
MESIYKTILNLSPIGFAVFGIGFLMMVGAIIFLQKDLAPKPMEKAEPPIVDEWTFPPPRKISDSTGKTATIQLMVLSKDFSWVLERHDSVERHGKVVENFKKEHLQSPGISGAMLKYLELIAVGAASAEGALHNAERERTRAKLRAEELQLWIKESVSVTTPLHTLSLGYFKGNKNSPESSAQRKIVIIGVKEKTPGINLKQALRDTLGKMETFPFNPDNYSEFVVDSQR